VHSNQIRGERRPKGYKYNPAFVSLYFRRFCASDKEEKKKMPRLEGCEQGGKVTTASQQEAITGKSLWNENRGERTLLKRAPHQGRAHTRGSRAKRSHGRFSNLFLQVTFLSKGTDNNVKRKKTMEAPNQSRFKV